MASTRTPPEMMNMLRLCLRLSKLRKPTATRAKQRVADLLILQKAQSVTHRS